MRRTYHVLHTADWHLGIRLYDQERSAEHAAFFSWLLDTIVSESVHLLIIAGDIFDSATPPQSALEQWYTFLATLHQRCPQTQVLAIAGNHDSPAVLAAARHPLASIRADIIATWSADTGLKLYHHPDDDTPALAVAAVPFLRDRDLRLPAMQSAAELEAELRTSITRIYAEAAAALAPQQQQLGIPTIALGHLTAAGSLASESERDIHIGNLGAITPDAFPPAFAAILLGHLHRPQHVAPHQHIRYSGSPIPLSFSESRDHKEVRLLHFADGALIHHASLPIPLTRPLLRLRVTEATLEEALRAIDHTATPLPPWLELTVTACAASFPELTERIHIALGPHTAALLHLRRPSAQATPSAAAATPSLQELSPSQIFDHILEAHAPTAEEAAALRLTFTTLLELHHQSAELQP